MKKIILIAILFSVSFMSAQTTSGKYTVKNIYVNTEYADFGTTYFGKDSIVFSSPTKKKGIIRNVWKPNAQPYLDLYVGAIDSDGEIIGKHRIEGNANTKFHEAVVTFTKDMKTVYYTGNNNYDNVVKNDTTGTLRLQLYKGKVGGDGAWTDIEKLPFNNDDYSTGHPALSPDGKKLYFVSDRPGSMGGTDIYVVDIKSDGTYSEPKNLGKNINTKGKELFPFITADNILYYSSDGQYGSGGLDIFANKIYNTTVSRPLNLGEPINSVNDDFAFIMRDGKGYFSSSRDGGAGGDDIYGFLINEALAIDCTQEVKGTVKNPADQKVLADVAVQLLDKDGKVVDTAKTDAMGTYNFKVKCDSKYTITAAKDGFQNDEQSLTTAYDIVKDPNQVGLFLKQAIVENKINIENIYFDLDRYNIRKDASLELDKLVKIMKDNPEIIVEAGSHTDSRATDKYNNRLSTRRAKATVRYIVSKGISKKRISAKGFGETQLANHCSEGVVCTDAEHQANRRTEFVIVNKDKIIQASPTVAPTNTVKGAADKAKAAATNAVDQVKEGAKKATDKVKSVGANAVDKAKEGAKDAKQAVKEAVKGANDKAGEAKKASVDKVKQAIEGKN